MSNKKLVVFDMDGTLITGNTWEDFNTALGVTKEQDWDLYSAFSKDEITYDEWLEALKSLYNLTKNKHSKENVLEYLTQYTLAPEAKAALDAIHAAGHQTLLLSGSFQMTADAVAFELGIHDAIATTKCVFDQEGFLTDLHSAGDEQHAKVRHLQEYCTQHNVELSNCTVIGDGPNDIPLFMTVGTSFTFASASDDAKEAATHTIANLTEMSAIILTDS